ncbi:porin [Burkholderia sp. SCN-KJ]|uniref:porin n=1 Tax=Burkholderia sp. SCN-KJ TaxID=2969248 RepID=UPI00214FD1DE|nr:porin [Burkholderia sp. SCN-KJ]MCR4471583.1 porin [Burkholderia sp. SCN-KJ]
MKRALYFASVLVLAAGTAHAQSAVTLYGRVASGLDFVSNVATANGQSKTNYRFGSNQYGISWWGLTGDEDLGGGLHAVFKLESEFTLGQGQLPDASLFNRYAYVGLADAQYGALWIGRVMSLTDETGYYLDPFGEQATGIANFAKGRAWGSRANTVTYNSPKLAGFSFRLQNGFGNDAASFRNSRQFSASATYSKGGFNGYGLYEEIRDANGKFSSLYSASREYMIGATYQVSALKLYAGYQQLVSSGKDTVADSTNPVKATRNQQEWLGATYQVNSALSFQVGWFHGNVNHGGGSGNLGVVGTTYSLSKRTFLYATFGAMFNGGIASFPVETADSLPLQGRNQQGGYIGMMHYF